MKREILSTFDAVILFLGLSLERGMMHISIAIVVQLHLYTRDAKRDAERERAACQPLRKKADIAFYFSLLAALYKYSERGGPRPSAAVECLGI